MAPPPKRTIGAGVVVGLLIVSLVSLPGMARADLGSEPSKTEPPSQIEDTDRPKESILEKKPADAAVASKKAESTVPIYEKWQFWAIIGGAAVGIVVGIIASQKISHQVAGGDARPCSPMFITCKGAGQ